MLLEFGVVEADFRNGSAKKFHCQRTAALWCQPTWKHDKCFVYRSDRKKTEYMQFPVTEFTPIELELHQACQCLGLIQQLAIQPLALLFQTFIHADLFELTRSLLPLNQQLARSAVGKDTNDQQNSTQQGYHPSSQNEPQRSHGVLPISMGVSWSLIIYPSPHRVRMRGGENCRSTFVLR